MHNIYYLGLSGEHRCHLGYLFTVCLSTVKCILFSYGVSGTIYFQFQLIKETSTVINTQCLMLKVENTSVKTTPHMLHLSATGF